MTFIVIFFFNCHFRLCEELEYSELLDNAALASEAVERMTLVAAFAISAYGYCNARAGHKPFNPLLGKYDNFILRPNSLCSRNFQNVTLRLDFVAI